MNSFQSAILKNVYLVSLLLMHGSVHSKWVSHDGTNTFKKLRQEASERWKHMPLETLRLYTPPLCEVAEVLERGLKKTFTDVSVSVVKCPNLTKPPFYLAAKGLSGRPVIIEIGGMNFLIPIAFKNKIYNLENIAKRVNMSGAFMIGQGTGPFNVIGTASEFIANIRTKNNSLEELNFSYNVIINKTSGSYELFQVPSTSDFGILAQVYASEGSTGNVLEIKASRRIEKTDFLTRMRTDLRDEYGSRTVGIGGVFLIKNGRVNATVQPDFSPVPLTADDFYHNHLKYFNVSAPLVCSCIVESYDPGFNLTNQHSHCFSNHGDGGHYINDVIPDEVEYLGYLSIAEFLYRLDRPGTN